MDWQQKTYTITSTGPHTLEWRFIMDGSGDGGKDCGWVDSVQWTGSPPPEPSWDTITYKYDPSGRRIEKDVDGDKTTYVYDGGNIIAEYDGNNNLTRKYIHGARVDELLCMIDVADSNAVYYYHYDATGSVIALSNSSGDSCQSYEYSVYGQVAASDPNFTANPYMFTGRRFDYETGLYYYRARYYNPYIGRFLQTDLIGYEDGMNLYRYCMNNPINLTDPYGLSSSEDSDEPIHHRDCRSIRTAVERDPNGWPIWKDCYKECTRIHREMTKWWKGGCRENCSKLGSTAVAACLMAAKKGLELCIMGCNDNDDMADDPRPPCWYELGQKIVYKACVNIYKKPEKNVTKSTSSTQSSTRGYTVYGCLE